MGWQKDGSGLDVKRVRGLTVGQWCEPGGWRICRGGRMRTVAAVDVMRMSVRDRRTVRSANRR
jgi:hypothetical protein